MTTFQDLPPQSRRAVRQSERDETAADATVGTPSGDAPQPSYSFDPGAEAPDAVASSDASAEPTRGRRAQPAAGPRVQGSQNFPGGYEPLDYATQARPQVPSYDGPSFRNRPIAPVDGAVDAAPADPAAPAYKVRDFSPEGRRAALSREAAAAAPAPAALDYNTQNAAPFIPADAVASTPQAPSAPVAPPATSEHTMSRRELREARAAEERPALVEPGLPEPISNILNSGPINLPYLATASVPSPNLSNAMAEFDALTSGSRGRRSAPADAAAQAAAAPADDAAQAASAPAAEAAPVEAQPVAPPVVSSVPLPVQPIAPPAASWTSAPAPTVDSVPSFSSEPVKASPVLPTDYPQREPHASDPVIPPASSASGSASASASVKPNHWSAHLDDDEGIDDLENTLSRTVGGSAAAITTSALVLPSIPQASDITSPFTATGEILVTGSIHLPRSLGATGAHPHRVDNSDFEDDPMDNEVISTDSAPVRAIRAVSTHTGSHGVIAAKKPQGNRVLTAMIITASVLAVGVLGLLVVAGIASGMFGK
ncbi:MAG: hypothetical protein JWQ12_563 [Glaciihabitans sp.]|nr:hypothetical protein [Glaciihabitans sp.]